MTYLTGAAVIARVWARFLSAFPDVQLEVPPTRRRATSSRKGSMPGSVPRDWAAADMIAVRVIGRSEWLWSARRHISHGGTRHARPMISPGTAAFNSAGRRTASCSHGHSSGTVSLGRSRWMAESSSTIPIWPLARLSTGSDRVRGRAVADPFLRSGAAGSRAGELHALLREVLSLLSRPSASAGRAARPHRHAPHRPRVATGQGLLEHGGRLKAIAD